MNYKKGEEPTEADDLLLEEKMAKREPNSDDSDEDMLNKSGNVDTMKVLQKQREFNMIFKKVQAEKEKST